LLIRAATVRLSSLGISRLARLALIPSILRHLGDHRYGIWIVVGTPHGL
jgi:hypothetical protein